MNKKRLVIVHEWLGSYGGAEQYLAFINPELQKDYDLHLLYWKESERGISEAKALYQSAQQVNFEDQEEVSKKLDSLNPDLIFVHKCLSVPAMEALKNLKQRVIHYVHDHEGYCMRGYKYFPWSRKICTQKAGPCCIAPCLAFIKRDAEKGALGLDYVSYSQKQKLIELDQSCDAHFVGSSFMKDELQRQGYNPEKITIIPPVPKELPKVDEKIYSDENLILFVGQVIRGKGLDCLIQALSTVSESYRLLVIGDGSHLETCKKLASDLGVSQKVEFLGHVPHHKLAGYYKHATLGVVPSVWPEPFSIVGLEFMSAQLPVVAFDSGGISDWLENERNGFLIPWMEVDTMAEKISRLLKDKSLAEEMGQQGRRKLSECFGFDKTMELLKNNLCWTVSVYN